MPQEDIRYDTNRLKWVLTMKDKHDFLDPMVQHTLTEQECELLTFFRLFTKTQRQALVRVLFTIALDDKRLSRMAEKRKEKDNE